MLEGSATHLKFCTGCQKSCEIQELNVLQSGPKAYNTLGLLRRTFKTIDIATSEEASLHLTSAISVIILFTTLETSGYQGHSKFRMNTA